jgi:hypothetical protein
MRIFGILLALVALAACEPTSSQRPAPQKEPSSTGVSVSGYARVGVSNDF